MGNRNYFVTDIECLAARGVEEKSVTPLPKTVRNRRTPRVFVFVLVQLIVAALLFEIALRVLRPHVVSLRALLFVPGMQTDFDSVTTLEGLLGGTVLGWAPCTIQRGFVLNERSFRTHDYTAPGPAGTTRVMALGDSFTFASGGVCYRDMWPTQLEQALNEHFPDQPSMVFSLGVPGVGPAFQLRVFEFESPRVRPDLVVVGFFVGNDFTDESQHPIEGAGTPWPIRMSYLARLGRNAGRVLEERWCGGDLTTANVDASWAGQCGVEIEPQPGSMKAPRFTSERFLAIEGQRMHICLCEKATELDALAAEAARVFIRLRDEVCAAGSDLVVMMIPDEYQVDDELRSRVLASLGRNEDEIDIDRPQQVLGALLDDAGIATLDLLPVFRAGASAERLYWERNTHWNVAGNHLGGKTLAAFVVEHGLIDDGGPAG